MSNDNSKPASGAQPAAPGSPGDAAGRQQEPQGHSAGFAFSTASAFSMGDQISAAAGVSADAPAAEIETLNGQIKDLTDRLLRAHADMENLRKRTEREKEETTRYAIAKFARDVVGVADNFDRAISSVSPDAAAGNAALKSLLDGVSMTEREFLNVLERHGVKRIDPRGEPFNPHQHQAVMEAQDASVPSGTVVQVFQLGYLIEDRVLRPAMVVVAKGGTKVAKPAEAAPPDAASTPQTDKPFDRGGDKGGD